MDAVARLAKGVWEAGCCGFRVYATLRVACQGCLSTLEHVRSAGCLEALGGGWQWAVVIRTITFDSSMLLLQVDNHNVLSSRWE